MSRVLGRGHGQGGQGEWIDPAAEAGKAEVAE